MCAASGTGSTRLRRAVTCCRRCDCVVRMWPNASTRSRGITPAPFAMAPSVSVSAISTASSRSELWSGITANTYQSFADQLRAAVDAGASQIGHPEASAALMMAVMAYYPIVQLLIGHTPGESAQTVTARRGSSTPWQSCDTMPPRHPTTSSPRGGYASEPVGGVGEGALSEREHLGRRDGEHHGIAAFTGGAARRR
jgi:hypothetical protein